MNKIWYSSYPKGVAHTIDQSPYDSLVDMMEHSYQHFPNHVALSHMHCELSYAELDNLSRKFAAYLQKKLTLKRHTRVAIMLPNVLQFPITMMGILRAGMIVVNVNPLYTARELVHQLNDSGAQIVIVLANFASKLEKALPDTKVRHVIVTELGDSLGLIQGTFINGVIKYIKRLVPRWHIPQAVTYKAVMHEGACCSFQPVKIKPDDIAFLQYTGGTTGVAKGAMLLHRNMLANTLQVTSWVRSKTTLGEESVIVALPLYHIFSLTVCCFCFFSLGARCILVTNPRDLDSFVKVLAHHAFSFFVGINTLFYALCDHPKIDSVDFSHLKLTVSGGMALKSAVVKKWQRLTGQMIIEGYGLTETSPVLTINPIDATHFNHSVGLPIPSTEVMVQDEQGLALPFGKQGELCARGPQVMPGYWQRPEASAEVLDKQGWLRTGDIARIDERGFVYIVDRKKDMIVVSGFNVYPNEVEEVISTMPQVKEVAVIGVPCQRTGEAVKAFIVKNHAKMTKQEVIDFCRKQLTPYKVPKQIEFRTDLPKSNIGKILRRELRVQSEK